MLKRLASVGIVLALTGALAACGNNNNTNVGSVGVDWTGNDIAVEAVPDPEVQGVVCHVAYFNRSLIDRLQQGNWLEDPSYSAIDCNATGPVTIGDINVPVVVEIFACVKNSVVIEIFRSSGDAASDIGLCDSNDSL